MVNSTLQGTNISPTSRHFWRLFPFPKVGYVSFLEGNYRNRDHKFPHLRFYLRVCFRHHRSVGWNGEPKKPAIAMAIVRCFSWNRWDERKNPSNLQVAQEFICVSCIFSHSDFPVRKTRLQICPLFIFGNKATDGTYGSKYWFPGFGFASGPNLQPWKTLLWFEPL